MKELDESALATTGDWEAGPWRLG